MDISDSSLTPHTNSLVKFLDCDHSLPGGVNILSDFHDLRLYGRDILRVCLNRINHRLQYARCLSHIGQSYVSYRLPDPVGALDASVIFGFQSVKSSTKFVCVLQMGRKSIRLYATNTVHIAHVRIFRIDNPPFEADESGEELVLRCVVKRANRRNYSFLLSMFQNSIQYLDMVWWRRT